MRGEGKLLVGPREALLCYRLSSITRASTESSTHQVIFTPHSEKQNHGSVKAALLCFFLFQMKIKAFQCLLICLTSLLTYSGCSQAFWYGESPYLSEVPGFPGELDLCKYNQQQRNKARTGCVPGPPAFPWPSPPLQHKPQGAELLMLSSGVRRAPAHLQQVLQGRGRSLEWWHCSPASSYRPAQLRQQLSSLPCSLLTTEFI